MTGFFRPCRLKKKDRKLGIDLSLKSGFLEEKAFKWVLNEPEERKLLVRNYGMPQKELNQTNPVTLREAFWVWVKVALLSFGGPAGQIAVMHKTLVDEKKWISESRFIHALNYCMLLPGPEAQQLTIYIGWLMHRWLGGVIAGILFILPGFISILILSIVYALYGEVSLVNALFFGLKPAVVAIVIGAVIKIGSKTLKTPAMVAISGLSFAALFFFDLPFPLVIIAAALTGFLGGKFAPRQFVALKPHSSEASANEPEDLLSQFETHAKPSLIRSTMVLIFFGVLWALPLLVLFILAGSNNIFFQQGIFFSKTAVVTFGGAYAVLGYIAQQAVDQYGWLKPGEMLDGLGMAETTPGPLIQVVQFVGFMGAFRAAEAGGLPISPVWAGVMASVITTWVTFVPCFLWIFLGAPYVEQLRNNENLSRALSAITAAVVGVVLNLAIWFALHVIFKTVDEMSVGPLQLNIPDFATLDLKSLVLALTAILLTFIFKFSMMKVIGSMIVLGFAAYFI